MKYIRLLLISFIVLFFFITIISLFIPSHIKLSKAINLKADKTKLMGQISDPLNWKKWYPGLDSASVLYKEGIPRGWVMDKKGHAFIEIVTTTDNEVQAKFRGGKRNAVVNGWKIISYSQTDSVTLQWYINFHLRWYPWEKFSGLLLEGSYGPKMEQGLSALKQLVEN